MLQVSLNGGFSDTWSIAISPTVQQCSTIAEPGIAELPPQAVVHNFVSSAELVIQFFLISDFSVTLMKPIKRQSRDRSLKVEMR
jgi:hypothetical protein